MDVQALRALLRERIEPLALELLGEPSVRSRREWRWGRHGSLSLVIRGEHTGQWFDHEISEGGDVFRLIMRERQLAFPKALAWAGAWRGGMRSEVALKRARAHSMDPTHERRRSTRELARRVWAECVDPTGTLVEAYLSRRRLALPYWPDDPGVLRFHPACPRGNERQPAMVALMTDPLTNEPVGIHRTFLLPDGSDRLRDEKGKAMLGNVGVIRLSPEDEITTDIGIAEGIETALSLMQCIGWRPIWVATSAGGIARFPLLEGIETITVFADADRSGMRAARVCAQRWHDVGREARIIAPPSGDWNDAVRSP
jgi:hypothetical protein